MSAPARRVLMVAPTPFFADRGCHVRILGEARALQALGTEVLVCTYPLGRDVPEVRTQRTVPVPWYRKLAAGPSLHKPYIDLLLLGTVLRACRRFRPHVIHGHLHEGAAIGKVAARLFRLPLVADLQGSLTGELLDHGFLPGGRWVARGMGRIESAINAFGDHVVVSSSHLTQGARRGLPAGRTTEIADGVDVDVFRPQPPDPALRASLGILPQEQVVVFIGVLSRYQGIDLLLEAAPTVIAEIPAVKLLLIGYPNEAEYRDRARGLGVAAHTVFPGRVPYHEAPRYLALADVAVSPKISTTEANQKLFAYMAMGLPSVVFDTPVNRDALGETGVYAAPGDVPGLARALVGLLRDRDRAAGLGARARDKAVRERGWLAVGHRLQVVYEKVCARGEATRRAARA